MAILGFVKLAIIMLFVSTSMLCQGQSIDKLFLGGDYTPLDSIQITRAYLNSQQAVAEMHRAMNSIWDVGLYSGQNKKTIRKKNWENNAAFMAWLGQPEKIRMVYRKIRKIHSKYDKIIFLYVTKENTGRCKGWISAWTIPFGRVKIRLCDDYLRYRTHLHEKTLIHELGHEAGMLLHRKIHGCWRAQRAAGSITKNVAKRNPENYAWLAMSYLGLSCSR